ncbi:MAG: WD40/YVTN/BNR-like repeat-containing protein [Acidimicrobiales bacterium]
MHPPIPPSEVRDAYVTGSQMIVVGISGQRLLVVRSVDAGGTWSQVALPAGSGDAGSAGLVVAGGTVVGISVIDQSSAQFSTGEWYATKDRGKTWVHNRAPAGGQGSATPGYVWIAPVGGTPRAVVYRSADSGANWTAIALPGGVIALGAPQALSDGRIVLVGSDSAHPGSSTVYMSGDAQNFKVLSTVSVAHASSSVAADTVWLAPPDGSQVVRVSAKGQATSATSHGFPTSPNAAGVATGPNALKIYAYSDVAGWADVLLSSCASGKSSCSERHAIFRTLNGGKSWNTLVPS